MASFDAKNVSTLEWVGIGAGALGFLSSFFAWASFSVAGFGGGWLSAWNSGFIAWFPVLLLLGAAGVVLAPHLGVEVPRLSLIWLGLAAGAVLIILLRWVTMSESAFGISVGAGFGLFLGLLAALASGVAAFLTYRTASASNPQS